MKRKFEVEGRCEIFLMGKGKAYVLGEFSWLLDIGC